MQFTPQQLAGGGRYSNKTKIGNWSEDLSLQEVRLAEYLKQKASGNLLAAQDRKQEILFTSRVPHSYAGDNRVRFGDTIMLQNQLTTGMLASNLDTKVQTSGQAMEAYSVTAGLPVLDSNGNVPTARTTFVVMKWPKHQGYSEDGALRVGEPFLLAANPQLRVDEKTGYLRPPVCLMSEIVDTMRYAAMSNHQRVTLQGGSAKYCMAWTVAPISDRKYHSIGQDFVQANTDYTILHLGTRSPLAADTEYPTQTNFGGEYEVACHQYLKMGKTLNMIRERDGVTTGDVGQRAQLGHNRWSFVMSTTPEAAIDNRVFLPMTPAGVIAVLRARLEGSTGQLRAAFEGMDDRGDGVLDKEEFRWGLKDFGVPLTDDEFDIVMAVFDRNGDGVVSFKEFIGELEAGMETKK